MKWGFPLTPETAEKVCASTPGRRGSWCLRLTARGEEQVAKARMEAWGLDTEVLEAAERGENAEDADVEWSAPLSIREWAKTFGISRNTMSEWFRNGTVRARQLSENRWAVDMRDLPTTT